MKTDLLRFNGAVERDPAIDALWICSANQARIENLEEIQTALATKKGKLIGIACEKPLARNVAEALQVVDLAKRAGIIGVFKGGPADLSTNPAHMEGFGRD